MKKQQIIELAVMVPQALSFYSDALRIFIEFTSTSTKSLKTPVYKGISRGGSSVFHFHLTSTFSEQKYLLTS